MLVLSLCSLAAAQTSPQTISSPATETPDDNGAQAPPAKPDDKSTRMFGVLPNYATVERADTIDPIDARRKFALASLNTFDPYVFPFVGVVAAFNQQYGGSVPYLKQYAASMADNDIGNFMTTAVLPSLLHQDPRYFTRGTDGLARRAGYAASRILTTRSDAGHAQFNFSEVGGTAFAASVSNLYYPRADRTVGGTLERMGMQMMWDALSNELKEFWPDVRRRMHHS